MFVSVDLNFLPRQLNLVLNSLSIFLLMLGLVMSKAIILSGQSRVFLRGILILEAYLLTLIITKSSRNKFLNSGKP